MALRTPSRYTVLAGLFLLGSVALAIVLSFVLSGGIDFSPRQSFSVRFSLENGAPGLRPGSFVTLGGQRIGEVASIEFREGGVARAENSKDNGENPLDVGVIVGVRVRSPVTLRRDAVVSLERPLLGSASTLNISSVGSTGAKALQEGETIAGGMAPPGFLAQAGLGPKRVGAVGQAIDDLAATISNIKKLVEDNGPRVDTIVQDVGSVTKSTRESWPKWSGDVDTTLTNVRAFSDRLGPMADNFNGKVDEFGKLVGNVNSVVDENRQNVKDMISDARTLVSDLRTKSMPTLDEVLTNSRDATSSFRDLGRDLNAWAASQLPELRRTVANLRVISDQGRRAVGEIRAQPWRLFFQPEKKELEADVLFRAANAYADAVADMRSAAESMQNTLALSREAKPGTAPPPEVVSEQLRFLQESMSQFRQAENDLLDVMILQSGRGRTGESPR